MKIRENGVYTTHGEIRLLCEKREVNGQMVLAFVKNDKIYGYVTLQEVNDLFKNN